MQYRREYKENEVCSTEENIRKMKCAVQKRI
jgi:hypothetical protein